LRLSGVGWRIPVHTSPPALSLPVAAGQRAFEFGGNLDGKQHAAGSQRRLAVWPNSTTAANLRRGSGVLLSYVAPNTVLYVRGHTLRTWQARVLAAEIGVDQVTTDEHPGFTVTDGIRFEYEGRSESLATTWGRQLALLREVS